MGKRRYTVQELLKDPSFIRWAEGKLDRREAEPWDEWVKETERNRRIARRAQQRILGVSFEGPKLPDIQRDWVRIQDKVTVKERTGFVPREVRAGESRDLTGPLVKAAAGILVVALVGLSVYLYQGPEPDRQQKTVHTVKTGFGEKKTINLSDGSRIILAAGSNLSYREGWLNEPTKRVSLEGEAFFSVSPQNAGTQSKLVVETEDGSVSVWGTRFSVDTYGTGTRVVLQEGDVRVKVADPVKPDAAEFTVKPGEMARFSRSSGSVTLKKVNPLVYTSWTTNELFFDNTPLSVLVNRIELTYGIEVEVTDPEMLEMELSGSVDFRSLDGLINAVSEVLEIRIQRCGDTVIINQNQNK